MVVISLNQVLNLIYKSLDDTGKQIGVTDTEVLCFQKMFENKYQEFGYPGYLFFGQTEQNYASSFNWWYNFYEYNSGLYRRKKEDNANLFSKNYVYNLMMLFYELRAKGLDFAQISRLISEVETIFFEYYQAKHTEIYIHNSRIKSL